LLQVYRAAGTGIAVTKNDPGNFVKNESGTEVAASNSSDNINSTSRLYSLNIQYNQLRFREVYNV